MMTSNKIYRIVFFSIIQIIIYIVVYELGWFIGSYFKGVPKNDLFWGVTIKFALFLFIAISILGTIVSEFFIPKTKTVYLILFAISFIVFSLFFIKNYKYVPFKTLLLLTSALAGLTVKWLISMRTMTK